MPHFMVVQLCEKRSHCINFRSNPYLIRPGTVHDEFIDNEKRAMDTIVTTKASASVTLGGTFHHTTDGFSIRPLHRGKEKAR